LVSLGLLVAHGAPGDDEEWDAYYDPRHYDFGRVRIGRSLIDMTFGIGQHLSLMTRLVFGEDQRRWKVTDTNRRETIVNYGRGKLSPVGSLFGDVFLSRDQTSLGGDPVGSSAWWIGKVTPLIAQDITNSLEKEGPAMGAALGVLTFFGIGAQAREQRITERVDLENELRAGRKQGQSTESLNRIAEEHLRLAAIERANEQLRTADPDDVDRLERIAANNSDEMPLAVNEERGRIIMAAIEQLSSEDVTGKKQDTRDKAITTARALVRNVAPTYDDASLAYREAYKRQYGTITEAVGGKWRLKRNVLQALQRLRRLYPVEEAVSGNDDP